MGFFIGISKEGQSQTPSGRESQIQPDMPSLAKTTMNDARIQSMSLDQVKLTDSLIKLTADTLIYASISYSGPKLEYQHDDKYFVRN
jgi:hypothetical protein